jgi:hypothetical protein
VAHSAYLPIIADRYGAVVRHIFVAGLDLTDIEMRAQVRLYGDVPGAPLVDLLTVANGNAQGLRLVEVTSDDAGLPTSHIELVINETTMEALPYAGEIGDVTTLAWDWQITIAGRKRRLAKGEFQITGDGVTGAEVAPSNRISPFGLPQRPVADVWSSARMTFGEEQVTVEIDGADLLAPLVKAAENARDAVKPMFGNGAPSAAIGMIGSVYYDTTDPFQLVVYGPKTGAGWGVGRSMKGEPGGAGNVAANLDQLKRAAIDAAGMYYDGHWFAWIAGDYSNRVDDVMFVKANGQAAAVGAWVRQVDVITPQLWMTKATRAQFVQGLLPDCIEAFQKGLDFCAGKNLTSLQGGRRLSVPGGRYSLSRPLVFNFRKISGVTDDQDMRRPMIEGEGRAAVEIFYEGANGAAFEGSVSGTVLTVAAVTSGELHVGAVILGPGIPDDTVVTEALTGTAGTGTYRINRSLSASGSMTSKSCAIFLQGNSGPPTEGVNLHTVISNITLRARGSSARKVDGIRLYEASNIMLDDTTVDLFDTGIDGSDCIRLSVTRCEITGNNDACYLRPSIYSRPNVVKFSRVDFGGNIKSILRVTKGANVEFHHCGMEGNGDGTKSMVQVEGGPEEGGICFTARGCYVENNHGIATFDIDFNEAPFSGTIDISGNSLRRNANNRVCKHEILLRGEGTARLIATIANNGFEAKPEYIPSADRPVVKMTFASTKVRIHGLASNDYEHQIERPDLSGFIAEGYGYDETVANARVNADGTLAVAENIAFVDKGAGPGVNRLHYKVAPRSPTVIPATLEALGGPSSVAKLTAENAAYAEVTTYANGIPTDMPLAVTLKGLLS